jgi:anti-sigma regulatory factor (Ser/Thr protein kinase)
LTKIARDPYVSCVALPSMATSISTARLHTRIILQKWRLTSLVDDAELVVSELVTNALKASNIIPAEARYPELYDRLEVVCLCLQLLASNLLIEVSDPKKTAPRRREVAPDDEGGRGLWLVESLARQWGTRWPRTGGKVVWAAIALEGGV